MGCLQQNHLGYSLHRSTQDPLCLRVRYIWEELWAGEGDGTPPQYSCLENPMDGGAWWAAVQGVTKSRTQLSDFTFTFHFHALEKQMAPHSSVLAWRITGTGEPGGLLSMGSHRVRHDWSDAAAAAAAAACSWAFDTSCSLVPTLPPHPLSSCTLRWGIIDGEQI